MELEFTVMFPLEFSVFAVVLGILVAMVLIWAYKFVKSLIPGLGD